MRALKGRHETLSTVLTAKQKGDPQLKDPGSWGNRVYHRNMSHAEVPNIIKIMWALQCGIFSKVLLFAQAQIARQNAILFTKSARLYTRFRASLSTDPQRYPKK